MKKKIISLSLLLLMMMTFIPAAMASGDLLFTAGTVEIESDATTVDVPITLTNNPGFASAGFYVRFNSSVLTYKSVAAGTVFGSGDITVTDKGSGLLMVSINESRGSNKSGDGTLATFTFDVVGGSAAGAYTIELIDAGAIGGCYNEEYDEVDYALVNGSVTIKAAAPTNYTVTYNANGGSTVATTDTVAAGSTADLSPVATKEGFDFLGWNTDPDATVALSSYTVTGDITLYAIYEEIIPEALLKGVITRGASSATVDQASGTIAVSYDTKQTIFSSSYVAFGPVVDDGVTVTYTNKDNFISTKANITNYTEINSMSGTPVTVNLATEKATTKTAKLAATIAKSNVGLHEFVMTLDNGVTQESYNVALNVGDAASEDEFVPSDAVFKTFRDDDGVTIDTKAKEITLTTKNKYNYTTIAIKGSDFGPSEGRVRRVIEVLDANDGSYKYIDFKGEDFVNYDRAVLINYGADRSYNIRIYGGEDGLSYEDYTLNVHYVASRDLSSIILGNNRGLHNAKLNSAADCNANGRINVTYKTTGGDIRFSPVYAKGRKTAISGDEGLVYTVWETVAGAEREVYVIDEPTLVPSAMKYLVTCGRDTRTFDVNFIEG